MWLTSLKIAIVEKNIEKFSKLMADIPQLQTQSEMEEALFLIREASSLVNTLKDETSASMKQQNHPYKLSPLLPSRMI